MGYYDDSKNKKEKQSFIGEAVDSLIIGLIITYILKDIVEFTKFMFRLIWWILRLPIILIKDHKFPKW